MIQFIYAVGTIVVQVFTLWLAMLGVLFLWDVAYSKLRSKRSRCGLFSVAENAITAAILTAFALAAGSLDYYIITPGLESGISYFFAG